jgi:hypothetical protein
MDHRFKHNRNKNTLDSSVSSGSRWAGGTPYTNSSQKIRCTQGGGKNLKIVIEPRTWMMNNVYRSAHNMQLIKILEGRENKETVRNTLIKRTHKRKTKIN